MELKDVLLNFRQENKVSQRELARRSGLSNSLISILEMGVNPQTGKKMSPDLDTYRKIATGMGISVQSLFEKLDDTELVSLSYNDLERALEMSEEEKQKTNEIRLLIRGLNRLTPAQVEQATNVFRAMFMQTNPELFDEGDDNE